MDETSKPIRSFTQLVHSEQIDWRPLSEPGVSGVFVQVLRFDRETRRAPTIILKFGFTSSSRPSSLRLA
jgi:hypothetical protein